MSGFTVGKDPEGTHVEIAVPNYTTHPPQRFEIPKTEALEFARDLIVAATTPTAGRCPRCHHVGGTKNPEGCALCNPERLGVRLSAALEELRIAKSHLSLTLGQLAGQNLDQVVLMLCEKQGFGAVMWSASRQWRERDPIGALSVGECFGTIEKEKQAKKPDESLNVSLTRIANSLEKLVDAESVVKKAFAEDEKLQRHGIVVG